MRRYLGELTAEEMNEARDWARNNFDTAPGRAYYGLGNLGDSCKGLPAVIDEYYQKSRTYEILREHNKASTNYAQTLARIILRIKAREEATHALQPNN